MAKGKHTSPPWNYVADDGTVRSENRGKKYNVICEVGVHGVQLAKVDHANGALIAATPNLYAACEYALESIDNDFYGDQDAASLLRAALGRARGEVA